MLVRQSLSKVFRMSEVDTAALNDVHLEKPVESLRFE